VKIPLRQIVEDYYRNSPDWPLEPPADLDGEVACFLADPCDWPEQAVRVEIAAFWAAEMENRIAG